MQSQALSSHNTHYTVLTYGFHPIVTVPTTTSQTRRDLCCFLNLSYRDVRSLVVDVSTISAKPNRIVVSFGVINACITRNFLALIMIDSTSEDFGQRFPSIYETVRSLESGSIISNSPELMALETVLYDTTSVLQRRLACVKKDVERTLRDAERSYGQYNLSLSQEILTALVSDADRAVNTLEQLLDEDEDIAALSFDNSVSLEEITDLLESYLFQLRAVSAQTEELRTLVTNTVELAELSLDHKRNQLMSLELRLTFAGLSMDTMCMIASILGMNVYLPNNESQPLFWGVCAITIAIGILIFVVCLIIQHYVEKTSKLKSIKSAKEAQKSMSWIVKND